MVIAGWRAARWDILLSVGVAAVVVAHAAFEPTGQAPTVVDFVLLAAASLALAARRRAPLVGVAVAAISVFIYLSRVGQDVIGVVPVLIAIYTAVRAGHRIAAPLTSFPFIGAAMVSAESVSEAVLPIGWFAAAVLMGEGHRQWQAYLNEAVQRVAEAERTQEQVALRRAGEERLRIARELHDSLTHTISVIKVQADVAIHLARKRGDDVPTSLLAIQEAARDATRELRVTLDVLRANDDAEPSGLSRLPDLVERARSAGVTADVTITGHERSLPSDVDRAAYRIVQEALTNVGRHAGTGTATVRVSYGVDEVTVQVDDNGRARPEDTLVPGVGLIGMRERVAALGGRLDAAPRPDGGFSVSAALPVGSPDS